MPSIEWNKRWGQSITKHATEQQSAAYGIQWGDPTASGWRYWLQKLYHRAALPGDLSKVVKHHIHPYLTDQSVVLEIGSGGGRWTQFLLEAKALIVVDLNPEFFHSLRERFRDSLAKLRFYETAGYELTGIDSDSIDFVFTFGTFVHIEPDGVDAYLKEIRRVLKPDGIAVIHYAEKSKKRARQISTFSDMRADRMEAFTAGHHLRVLDHNRTLLNHSNIIVVQK